MKKNEIQVGGLYTAKVNNKVVVVRVKDIRETTTPSGRSATAWDVENTLTGRWTTFRSAAKFRAPAPAPSSKPRVSPHATTDQKCPNCGQGFTADRKCHYCNIKQEPETNAFATSAADLVPGEASELMAPELAAAKSRAAERSDPTPARGVTKTSTPAGATTPSSADQIACPECGSEDVVEHVSSASCQDCGTSFALVDARRPVPAVTQAPKPAPAVNGTLKSVALPAPKTALGALLTAQVRAEDQGAPHVELQALAGTGKTTSNIEGLKQAKGLATRITPSEQQVAFWKALAVGEGDTVRLSAFNTTITDEMKERVTSSGLDKLGVEARGVHSLGLQCVTKAFGRLEASNFAVKDLVCGLLGGSYRDLARQKGMANLIDVTEELVGLCKQNYCEPTPDNLDRLTSHHDVEVNGCRDRAYELVPQVLDLCKRPTSRIAFDDMVWLPLVLGLPVPKVDVQIIDECQDLNRMQQELIYKAGRRVVFVGDKHQAIYGFAGSDSESMARMAETLGATPRGLVQLPLTVTRRCGKAIVRLAQEIVPAYEAHPDNPEGFVGEARYPIPRGSKNYWLQGARREELPWDETYCKHVRDGAMVLCRVNAPLVSQCFRFLKRGIPASIIGRNLATGLMKLVAKSEAVTTPELIGWLSEWADRETAAENAKKYPSDKRLQSIADKQDCLLFFCDGVTYASDVVKRINDVYVKAENAKGVRLATIHKSKGLEAEQVFLLQPEGAECPHPMAKKAWQQEQEMNCLYIARTRAVKEFWDVR